MTGFSEAEDYDWCTVQMCPAPPGTVVAHTHGDTEVDVPCPLFLLQEARGVIRVVADENGVGDRVVDELEPPFMTRVVPGVLSNCGCGQAEVDAAWGEASVSGVSVGMNGHVHGS